MDLETYFDPFRKNIIGIDAEYDSPFGKQKVQYFDWLASGRLYAPIEKQITGQFGPFVANTHTETSETGTRMTRSYFHSHRLIKQHVNAGPNDVIITAGFGMTSGVLIFDSSMYHNEVPDNPGGGTVDWTNPWGKYKYVDNIEIREDGGTPGFLQSIRTALTLKLKEQMGVDKILQREEQLVRQCLKGLRAIPGIRILADNVDDRLGVISFYHEEIHFNLMVKLLSDRFGIQVRGGCACAGTYGHFLLEVTHEKSNAITEKINHGDLSEKPGLVRVSLHPTMKDQEVGTFIEAVKQIIEHASEWQKDYVYLPEKNEFIHKKERESQSFNVHEWFDLPGDKKRTNLKSYYETH